MNNLIINVINDCYCAFLCAAVILSFLIVFKNYEKSIVRLFVLLCVLMILENVGGSIERYLCKQPVYSEWRLFLSWLCYLAGPALILTVAETLLRNVKKQLKWALAIPQFINIIVTTTCFFGPWCFYFEKETNIYVVGPLCWVPRMMPVIYLAVVVVAAFINVRKSKTECVIILVSSLFIVFDYINEVASIFETSFREVTVSITLLAYFMYFTSIRHIDEVQELSNTFAENEERYTKDMVDQSIETLSFTIDAKDRYTKGHSSRVAKYSRMIARVMGKSEQECDQIYRAGLLHDIGKISINGSIINKPGKLTEEEYAKIKRHPANGAKILEKMKSIPYLQDGAMYHHERYDGAGYPKGLKGEEIPELARIISVADAYDAMTSFRSYRPMMDQAVVKQEIWKGMGTQFDPVFAKIMIALIDADVNYDMREKKGEEDETDFDNIGPEVVWPEANPKNMNAVQKRLQDTKLNTLGAFICSEPHWPEPTKGVPVTLTPGQLSFVSKGDEAAAYIWNSPILILFTSRDGRIMGPRYDELGVFMSAGYSWRSGPAKKDGLTFTKNKEFGSWDNWIARNKTGMKHTVSFHREENTIFLRITNELLTVDGTLLLPDDYHWDIYIAVSGEHCEISELTT